MSLRQYEQDERPRLAEIVRQMNVAHAAMGGRDKRPERVALLQCMQILQRVIDHEHG